MPWIRRDDVLALESRDRYYCERRWLFYKEVIQFLASREVLPDGEQILEVGPRALPLSTTSHVLDREIHPLLDHRGRKVIVEDDICRKGAHEVLVGRVRLAVACQVFEHLEDPVAAWRNLRKLAKRILITIPWRWARNPVHDRDLRDLAAWTEGELPKALRKVRGSRLLAWYEF